MANNPSFGASASLNIQQPASAARSSNIDLASLEHASKTIQDQFVQDSRLVPDLNELLPGTFAFYKVWPFSDDSFARGYLSAAILCPST